MDIIRKLLAKYREYRYKKSNYHLYGNDWNYRYGFKQTTVDVCNINKENFVDFLSDRDYTVGHPWNGVYSSIIDNKLYLPMLFHNFQEYIPKYFYFKDISGFLRLTPNSFKRESVNDFIEILKNEHYLCLKHTHSSVGQGFFLVKYENGNYSINNKITTIENLKNFVDSLNEYIVTEYVVQHEYANKIHASSVNSIRMLCAWDYEKKEFFLARCFHRFGCNGNIVDNVGSGNGVLVFVDTESGVCLNYGAENKNKSGDKYVENIIHPDCNLPLAGLQIPNFKKVKAKVLQMANSVSFLRWVGFDVVITENSFKILETNSLSSLIDQGRDGYLKDPRLKKLFRK